MSINNKAAIMSAGTSTGADDIYYIPFVRDSQNYVNASLVIKASKTDTTVGYMCDWQYKNKPHGSPNVSSTAESFALSFMYLDLNTFNHQKFNITDTSLFSGPIGEGKRIVGFRKSSSSQNSSAQPMLLLGVICYESYVCNSPAWCAANNNGNCDYKNCYEPPTCFETTECAFIYGGDDDGGDDGSGNIGGSGGSIPGGGSGGGGGLTPPNPCGGGSSGIQSVHQATGSISTLSDPCNPNPGWTPIDDNGGYSYDPNNPFSNLNNPIDASDDEIINNGVNISDNTDSPNNPRTIAQTSPRGNTEDMQHGTNGDPSGIFPSDLLTTTDNGLFLWMKDLFHSCTIFDNDLKNVGDDMIQKFHNNTGGTYSNSTLNSKVSQSSTLINFLKIFGEQLNTNLQITGGNINNVSLINLGAIRPIFNGLHNKFHGLQILINDTEFTDIQLDNFTIDASGNWSADVTVTIHDHFGLDKQDALTYEDWHQGFPSWWLLQHTRDYVPFETIITVRKKISSHI